MLSDEQILSNFSSAIRDGLDVHIRSKDGNIRSLVLAVGTIKKGKNKGKKGVRLGRGIWYSMEELKSQFLVYDAYVGR